MSQVATKPPPVRGHTSSPAASRELMGHPVGLYVLFSTELWERFSFYSMRAFLSLYITKAMLLSKPEATAIYGAYLGFVYAAPFVGGMLADRLLGQRRAIVIGAILMALAQFSLAAHALCVNAHVQASWLLPLFFTGLGLLSTGNGFFKPNISSIVGTLYEQGDARRDRAFTIFYMGINIGALLSGITGWVAEGVAWHWGFLLAGCGMVTGLLIFLGWRRLLGERGLPSRPQALGEPLVGGIPKGVAVLVGTLAFIVVASFLLSKPHLVQNLALIVAGPILLYLVWEVIRSGRVIGGQIAAALVLCLCYAMFSCFFELAGSTLNFFADDHVNRTISFMGMTTTIKASFLTASLNPWYVVFLALPFALLWGWLDKRRIEPSSPLKFALGLLQVAAGFLVFYLGAIQAGATGRCHLGYLLLGFFLHTTGELCLSPVGLSTMTKLAPARLVSTIMGTWFLSAALGNVLGGRVGEKVEHFGYQTVFLWIAIIITVFSVLLIASVPILKRLMHGVK
ncbi:MAG TPA: peptide MFS transporter [Phycisphaerae bacterium]|nr:peptide MFS transporter [Phycisphaerae bacterium]